MNRRASAYFGIFMGLMMAGMWTILVLTGQVPHLDTPQVEIKLHIFTELITACLLVLGGVSLLHEWKSDRFLPFISHGMLIYAIINSSGYYIDLGETHMAGVFGVVLIGTILSLWNLTRP